MGDYERHDDRRGGYRDDRGGYRDDRRGGGRSRDDWDDRDRRDDRYDIRGGYEDYHYDADYAEQEAFDREEPPLDEERQKYLPPRDRHYEPLSCPVAHRCGGCEWLGMPYEKQLEMKQETVEELFAGLKCDIDPIVGMDKPVHYRNKVQLPFAPGHDVGGGRESVRWGIFERGTHHIVGTRRCLVEDARARPIIAFVADMLPRFNIKPYNERTGDGLIRYVLVRTAHHTGQIMVTLVCNGLRLPSEERVVEALTDKFPAITTIVLNTNKEQTSVILGKQERVLYGRGYIEDDICGCRFRISSTSFYQTNPVQAEKLYRMAIELADLRPSDHFGDAYCGTGTIGIAAAKASGAHLLGVERNPDAVDDARENAEANGIEDATFVVGDAGSVFARMARAGESLDVVFMDPPRAGASQAFLANLSRLSPRRVVYISCNPRSQLNDIFQMRRNGYRVTRVVPVDLFPHTDHIETIVLLERSPRGKGYEGRGQRGRGHDSGDDRSHGSQQRGGGHNPNGRQQGRGNQGGQGGVHHEWHSANES